MNGVSRREFLAMSAALAAMGVAPSSHGALGKVHARKIPSTQERLPVVGLGAPSSFYELPADGGADVPQRVIEGMLEYGGRVIDAPAFFHRGNPALSPLLQEMKLMEQLFLTGKITVAGKAEGVAHLERTERLFKRPMDLLMVHNMRELNIHWATLKDWKSSGRARYIGVSLSGSTDYSRLERFMKAEIPDFIMIAYSFHQSRSAERILPLAAELGIAVIAIQAFQVTRDGNYFELVSGHELPSWAADYGINSWAQFALKYILAHPAITCVVTETNKRKHIIDNMQAGLGEYPDVVTQQRMREVVLSL